MSNQAPCRYCGLPFDDPVHNSLLPGYPNSPGTCGYSPGANIEAYITITRKEYESLLLDRKQLQEIQGYIKSYYATIPICKFCNKRHQSKCAFDNIFIKSNPFIFPSLDDAIRNAMVYERARIIWRKNIDNDEHEGPYNKISDEEIRLAVRDLYDAFEKG